MAQKSEKFGKYVLLDKIAMGGMAEVYRGRAPGAEGIGKIVAIKRILPQYTSNTEFIEMFKSEAKIAVNLTHANIAQIYEFGEESKQFFLIMEFIDGKNLRQVLSRCTKMQKALTIEQCVFIIGQVANGLDYAHRCTNKNTMQALNIIHRDISPQNIMVSYEGEVKIIDFGIAKAESKIENTRTGTLKGKFGYMSPEQAEGLDLDSRTDIFSLGIVLWELLSGERLFVANNEVNTIRKIRDCQIPSLRKINPNIHDELERIVNRALAKDRSLRYQSAAELYRDLSRYLYKVNPEFTQHELSIFAKTIFKDDILEDRRKITEYAKLQQQLSSKKDERSWTTDQTTTETAPSQSSPASQVTTTQRDSQVQTDASNLSVPSNLFPEKKLESQGKEFEIQIDRMELAKQASAARSQTSRNTGTFTMARSNNTGPLGYTGDPSITYSTMYRRSFVYTAVRNVLVLVLLVTGLYYWSTKNPEMAQKVVALISGKLGVKDLGSEIPNPTATTAATLPSVAEIRLQIRTVPVTGAQIYIDEVLRNEVTPAELKLPKGKEVTITLRKDGFLTYVTKVTPTTNPQEVVATLQKASFGYLDLDVFPAKADIYIDGQKLAEKSPLRRYPVRAGAQIQIWAVNPYLNTEDRKTVFLKPDRVTSVKLYLKKKQ